jgi:hypothetical protein
MIMSTDADLSDEIPDAVLRAACRELAEDAPELAPLLAALPPRGSAAASPSVRTTAAPRPHRRVLAAFGAAAVVAAVAAGLVALLPGGHGGRPVTPSGAAAPTWAHPCVATGRPFADVTMRPVAGVASTSMETSACSGVATRRIQSDRQTQLGTVAVFAQGVFDTDLLAGSRPVSGSGINAYAATVRADKLFAGLPNVGYGCYSTRQGSASVSTTASVEAVRCPYHVLGWEYAPESWALFITADNQTIPRQLQIAAGVDATRPTPVRIPVRFDRLPAGLRAVAVHVDRTASGNLDDIAVDFGRSGQPGCPASTACERVAQIVLDPRSTVPHLAGTTVRVNGQIAYLYPGTRRPYFTLELWRKPWHVAVGGSPTSSDNQRIEIAAHAQYARSTSPATWFDTHDALPTRPS